MFESVPNPQPQKSKLETLLPQMINELEARVRASRAAQKNENPYDLIDAVIDSRELDIADRLKAHRDLVAHMRQLMQ